MQSCNCIQAYNNDVSDKKQQAKEVVVTLVVTILENNELRGSE